MCKAVQDFANEERQVERIDAIKNMIEWGVPEDRILGKYSKKEYEEAKKEIAEKASAFV